MMNNESQSRSSYADFMASATAAAAESPDAQCLSDVFRCFICMENVRDARLCPYCSKFVCFQCIRRWIVEQRAHCPHCRRSLRLEDLVRCNWADDLIQRLEMMQRSRQSHLLSGVSGMSNASASPRDGPSGGDDLLVMLNRIMRGPRGAIDCVLQQLSRVHLPSLCVVGEPGKHSGHSIKPLKDEYESRVRCVTNEIDKIRTYMCQLIALVQELEQHIETIKQTKEERVREVRCAVELMVARLDSQMKSKLISLTGQKRAISMEAEMIESVLQNVEHQLRVNGRARLLQVVPDLMSSLNGIQRTPHMPPLAITADFTSEIVPPFESQTFTLRPFCELRECSHALYSPPLHVNALTWRLKVYPNGNGAVRGNYLSVFIELSQGPPESISYDYRVSLLHQTSGDPARAVVREFSNDFEVGECWGYNRFYKITALSTEGFIDPNTDSLKLEFHVRSPNYFQKCKELNWFAQQLAISNQEKSGEIAMLKAQIAFEQEKQSAATNAPATTTTNTTTAAASKSDSPASASCSVNDKLDKDTNQRSIRTRSTSTCCSNTYSPTSAMAVDNGLNAPATNTSHDAFHSDVDEVNVSTDTDNLIDAADTNILLDDAPDKWSECSSRLRSTATTSSAVNSSTLSSSSNVLEEPFRSIEHLLYQASSTDGNEKDVEHELAQQRVREPNLMPHFTTTAIFDSVPQREQQQQHVDNSNNTPATRVRPLQHRNTLTQSNPMMTDSTMRPPLVGLGAPIPDVNAEDDAIGGWAGTSQSTTLDRIRQAFRMGVQNSQHIDFNLADSGSSTSSNVVSSPLVLVGAEIHTHPAATCAANVTIQTSSSTTTSGPDEHECDENVLCCAHTSSNALRSRHHPTTSTFNVHVGSPIVSTASSDIRNRSVTGRPNI